jgi:uncharacterized membrane protein
MAIEFRCVQCKKLLRTGDDTAGKQAKCPECGMVMTIPAASAGVPLPPAPLPPGGGDPFGATGPQPSGPADSGAFREPGNPFAPAGPGQSHGPIRQSVLDLGDVFTRAWTIFKPDWGTCLAVIAIVWAIGVGVNMVAGFIPIIGAIAALLFQVWINIGQAVFFLKKARGQDAAIEDVFSGWPYFWKILLATLLVGVITLGIVVVCVLPLVLIGLLISREAMFALLAVGTLIAVVADTYVSLMLSQFYYLILDRDVDIVDSLKMSKELTEGNKMTLFLIGLVTVGLSILACIPCFLGLLVAVPFFALLNAVIYLAITGQPTADQLPAGPAA